MGLLYWIIKKLVQTTIKIYFKNIHIIGEENIPLDGPLIICGNHSNQFIDPMMIMNYCPRQISFTMASSSYNKPVIGTAAKMMKAIPVNRPEDFKKEGIGRIKLNDKNESEINVKINFLFDQGINTKFIDETKNLKDGFSIMIDASIFMVDKIINDKKLLLKLLNFEDIKLLDKRIEYKYYVNFLI